MCRIQARHPYRKRLILMRRVPQLQTQRIRSVPKAASMPKRQVHRRVRRNRRGAAMDAWVGVARAKPVATAPTNGKGATTMAAIAVVKVRRQARTRSKVVHVVQAASKPVRPMPALNPTRKISSRM